MCDTTSVESLRAVLASMLDPHVLLSAVRDEAGAIVDFVCADANAAACTYNRLTYDELVGARLLDLLPGHDASGLFASYVRVVETGEPLVLDGATYGQELLGGEPRYHDVRAVRVGDGLSCTWRDVSGRCRDAAALAESEAKLRAIVESVHEGINVLDLRSGKYTYMSPSQVKMTGFTVDEMNELSSEEAYARMHPDDREISMSQQRAIAAGQTELATVEYRWRVRSGEYRWFRDSRSVIRDASGEAYALVGVSTDISDRKALEEALRESRETYRLLAENASDVVFRVATDGTFEWLSSSVWALLGWVPEDMVRRSFREFVHPDDLERVAGLRPRLAEGAAAEFEVRIATLAGAYRWVSVTARPVYDASGSLAGFVGSWRDIQVEVEGRGAFRRVAELDALTTVWQTLAQGGTLPEALVRVREVIAHHFGVPVGGVRLGQDGGEPRDDDAVHVLAAPLTVAWGTAGSLVIVRDQDADPFTTAERQLGAAMARAVAAFMEIEQLHSREKEQVAREERQALARDLHDAVTQRIFAASLMAEALPATWEKDPQRGRDQLERLWLLLRGALTELRTLLYELRPGTLEEVSLRVLLAPLADSVREQEEMLGVTEVDDDIDVPPKVKLAFCRVMQQALGNVVKHAGASRVTVTVRRDGACSHAPVVLTVEDDGRGFDRDAVPEGHMGLGIMSERLQLVGARLDVESEPGRGTTVRATWTPPRQTDA